MKGKIGKTSSNGKHDSSDKNNCVHGKLDSFPSSDLVPNFYPGQNFVQRKTPQSCFFYNMTIH